MLYIIEKWKLPYSLLCIIFVRKINLYVFVIFKMFTVSNFLKSIEFFEIIYKDDNTMRNNSESIKKYSKTYFGIF